MKLAEQVEYLLKRGKKPKELEELGFSKQIITRVRRKSREEKKISQQKDKMSKGSTEILPQSNEASIEITDTQLELQEALVGRVQQLEAQLDSLGITLKNIETRINGTPALDLKHRFKCDCGSSGFVALHIMCTKCERETWWGWHPEQ